MVTDNTPEHLSHEKIPTRIFADASEGSKVVAQEIAEIIKTARQNNRNAVLGLATGSTPKKVYAELIRLHNEEGLSFKNVVSFNLDEYYPLPKEAIQSYRRYMNENLFSHIDILPENCNIPDGTVPQDKLKEYCEEFEKKIERAGGMDFQLLGIGSNGHIGFNEPGSHVGSRTRLITLDLSTRADAASDFGGIVNVPKKAITMGVNTILRAKRIVLLVWGGQKAFIIKKAVEGPVTEFVPASYLQGHNNTTVVTDEAASAELTRRKSPWLIENVVWDDAMIKKAVTSLALNVQKPILKLTDNDYNENGLSDLLALYGQSVRYQYTSVQLAATYHNRTGRVASHMPTINIAPNVLNRRAKDVSFSARILTMTLSRWAARFSAWLTRDMRYTSLTKPRAT